MAEGKKTFIFYSDWINMVREMPDEDAGALLKHVLSYVNDEEPTTDNLLVKMAFGHMKPMLKKDLDKWEKIREKRREAGKKGGQANAKQNEANAKQVQAVNVNVNDILLKKETKDILDFVKLLSFINQKTGRKFKTINKDIKRKYESRLKDGYTKQDILNAVINASNLQYHKDNGCQHLTPEFFSRATTLDKYGNEAKGNLIASFPDPVN